MNGGSEKPLASGPGADSKPAQSETKVQKSINAGEPVTQNPATGVINEHHQIVPIYNGGPRTQLGRMQSSRNATKHGIFSAATLIRGESRSELETLIAELRETLAPQGMVEELLVDKLASISWRYRRLLMAETAEIETLTTVDLAKVDNKKEDKARSPGLIGRADNPSIANSCLELLRDLHKQIAETGFKYDRDMAILTQLYGDDADSCEMLRDLYSTLTPVLSVRPDAKDWVKEKILNEILTQIDRLKSAEERRHDSMRQQDIKVMCRRIPHGEAMERLLRYEATLERAFERVLAQLERMQRLRRGLAPAPRLDVSISS